MGELISKLGIDWRLLLANIITFLIVLWVLRRFAFKPILKILDERRALAQKTVDQEAAARAALAGADEQHKELVGAARQEAGNILIAARADAEAMKKRLLDEAKAEAVKIMDETRIGMRREKQAMVNEARNELAELVVTAAGALVEKKSGKSFNTQAAEEALKKLSTIS